MFKAIRKFFKKDKPKFQQQVVKVIDKSQEKRSEVAPQYQKWREVVFKATPEQVGVPKEEPGRIYGVIMDAAQANQDGTPMDTKVVVTETAFASGEASLQITSGGGIVGLGGDPEISEQAQAIVRLAQPLVNTAQPTHNYDNLPVSGEICFYFLTTSGIRRYKGELKEVQAQAHPFNEIFTRFLTIKARADHLKRDQSSKKGASQVKALYILTFTPQKMGGKLLQDLAFSAARMLSGKDAAFKGLMDSLTGTKTPIEIANLEYNRLMHSPQAMQSSMGGWLKKQYNLDFTPSMGENFFPHGMRNQQGQENFILFYFDFEA